MLILPNEHRLPSDDKANYVKIVHRGSKVEQYSLKRDARKRYLATLEAKKHAKRNAEKRTLDDRIKRIADIISGLEKQKEEVEMFAPVNPLRSQFGFTDTIEKSESKRMHVERIESRIEDYKKQMEVAMQRKEEHLNADA